MKVGLNMSKVKNSYFTQCWVVFIPAFLECTFKDKMFCCCIVVLDSLPKCSKNRIEKNCEMQDRDIIVTPEMWTNTKHCHGNIRPLHGTNDQSESKNRITVYNEIIHQFSCPLHPFFTPLFLESCSADFFVLLS